MHRKMRGFTEPLFELSRKKEGELLLHPGDLLVLFLLIGAGLWLLAHKWRKRDRSVTATWQWTDSSSAIRGEVPDMLREEGYDVVAAKQKLPVYVHVGSQSFESRLYVDYVAKQGSDVYLVMIARPKKPLSMTGAAIRDRFLSLFLALHPTGILYVDPERAHIHRIHFDIAGIRFPGRRSWVSYLITMVLGMLLAFFIR
jgi:hypothetical protein